MDETQNDTAFVAFYVMHAVTFVPPDEIFQTERLQTTSSNLMKLAEFSPNG